MLKRQGVKRAVRVAQIIKGVEGAVEYRAHQHPDIPDSEKPMTMLGNIAVALAKAVVFLRDLGLDIGHLFRGRRGKATFARVMLHQELRTLFPHIKGDFAFPTPPQGPMGREAYRLSRARIRGRFQRRSRYRKEPKQEFVQIGSPFNALRPEELENFRDACFRTGLLVAVPAEGETAAFLEADAIIGQ